MNTTPYHSGFVHLIGEPNVGKSTLMNNLIKYPISIATHKPQTTRQNIMGIDQGQHYQIIYVDTPGYVKPSYTLQKMMMKHMQQALIGGDILLWVVDIRQIEEIEIEQSTLFKYTQKTKAHLFLILNKMDLITGSQMDILMQKWKVYAPHCAYITAISALNPAHVQSLSQHILNFVPIHPPYYDTGVLTDKSERFLATDIIRKSLLLHYKQEIPYTTEIVIDLFKEEKDYILIQTTLYVERESQKGIILGKNGQAIKKMSTQAQQDLSIFFKKRVSLQQYVKVFPNWRNNRNFLTKLGY